MADSLVAPLSYYWCIIEPAMVKSGVDKQLGVFIERLRDAVCEACADDWLCKWC